MREKDRSCRLRFAIKLSSALNPNITRTGSPMVTCAYVVAHKTQGQGFCAMEKSSLFNSCLCCVAVLSSKHKWLLVKLALRALIIYVNDRLVKAEHHDGLASPTSNSLSSKKKILKKFVETRSHASCHTCATEASMLKTLLEALL